MNLHILLKEWLVETMGFKEHQIEMRGVHIARRREIVVYIGGATQRLHFVFDAGPEPDRPFMVDCCLLSGGMSSPLNSESIIETLCPYIDLRDPESLNILEDKVWRYARDYRGPRKQQVDIDGVQGEDSS
jgi:hypothetical protein